MFFVASLACGYVLASYYFLRHPSLLHRRKNANFPRCVHISHRGGAGESYENTMLAFDHAVRGAGTDMLELDCHITADGVVVVMHDCSLRRVADVDVRVTETTFDKLPRLSRRIPLEFVPGHSFEGEEEDDREIPTLESVFQAFPDTAINIDIKDFNMQLIQKVSALIEKYGRQNSTVWGNFKAATTEECYRMNPDVGLLFSFQRVVQILILYYSGLLPFMPIKETHFEVPMPSILKKINMREFGSGRMGNARSVIVTLLDKLLMRRKLFCHLQARGIPVYVWVLNTEEEYEKAFLSGVSGVMTDYPSRLASFLEKNPQYR